MQPPLPYSLRLSVTVDSVVPCTSVDATVGGDVSGPAALEVRSVDGGASSEARLVWSLTIQRPLLVGLERIARPAMVGGHDLVVALGVRQFRRKAL